MKNTLTFIPGLEIKTIPFELDWVGDLLFFDWPIISVLRSDEGKPFVKSWLESQNNINRYALFEIAIPLLESYIFGISSYLDVLLNPINDLIFTIDVEESGNIISTKIISSSYIPKDYLPKTHVLFDDEDSIELNNIIETFNLVDSTLSDQHYIFDIVEEAIKSNSELFNLHLASKNGKVGYGKVQSLVLGEVLVNYNKIAEATAINIYDKEQEQAALGNIPYEKKEVEFVKRLAATEYSYDKAASFSVFLKPIKVIKDKNSDLTSVEKIANNIFELFDAGTDLDELQKFDSKFSQSMLNAFSVFLRSIKNNDISITIQYGNPIKKRYHREIFNQHKSELIIKNLSLLEKGEPIENKVIGNFTALDRVHNTFTFLSQNNVKFEGKFDKEVFDKIPRLNFIDIYDVKILTSWERKTSQKENKARHIIIFCNKIKSADIQQSEPSA